MLKAKAELVEKERAKLNAQIDAKVKAAKDKAIYDGGNNGWSEELTNKYQEFLLKEAPEYAVEDEKKKLEYIESTFCEDEPETTEPDPEQEAIG